MSVTYVLPFFLVCLVAANAKFFKYEDCTPKNGITELSKFNIGPDPVNLRKNMTIDAALKILSDIPKTAVLKTRYYKLKSFFGVTVDVPIPCLLGKFGSCTLKLCEYLDMFRDQAEGFFPPEREYGCPVNAGDYGGNDTEVPIPDMTSIGRFIVSGKYRTELSLLDKRGGKELACYKIWAELR